MKYTPEHYAKALAAAITDPKAKSDALMAKNFLALVRNNGDEGYLPKIVEEAARLVRRTSGIRKVTVESARTLKPAQEKQIGRFLQSGDVVERKIDPALIAGIRIVVNDEMQFDGTMKHKLDRLWGG